MKLLPRSHPQLKMPRKTDPVSLGDWVAQHLETPVPRGDVPAQLLAVRLERNAKTVSLAGWRTPGLEQTDLELQNIQASEGLGRIVEIIRRAPGFEVLDGGHISFDETPTGSPEATRARWRDGLHVELSDSVLALAAEDPSRELDGILPVGTVYDLKDVMLERELRDSELYRKLYGDDLRNSWVGVIVERGLTKTWTLTMWHKVTDPERRLELRSALKRLASSLRIACRRIGLFDEPPILVVQSIEEAGILLPHLPEPRGFEDSTVHGKVSNDTINRYLRKLDSPSSAAEQTIEELMIERDRLRQALRQTEEMLLTRLGFAGAIPVSTFSATANALVKRLEEDPRPSVIYVTGTERTCILKPTDPDDLPAESTAVSNLSTEGGRLVERVYRESTRGTRIGLRRGGGRTGRVVAELCPPTVGSAAFLDSFRDTESAPPRIRKKG